MVNTHYKLNTGTSIPAIAYGGWGGLTEQERIDFSPTFGEVIKEGYKHIDTAWQYRTEKLIGQAIKASGVPREELFITTKLPPHHCGRVKEFFEESLKDLGVDYVDLYLVHHPISWADFDLDKYILPWFAFPDGKIELFDITINQIWAQMEELLETGKVRAIGVSNFSIKTLKQLLQTAKVVPAVNQVEMHPYLAQQDLLDFCNEKGIHITAYTPTGHAPVREEPLIKELAIKYNSTPTQVILGWGLARGVSVATRSTKAVHRKEVFNLPDLDPEDVEKITAIDKQQMAYFTLDKYGTIMGWTPEQYGWEHLKPATKAFWE